MSVSNSRRFLIFERDGFACRYCGRQAPDVPLQADHIHPKSKGGSDHDENLVTACIDCNSGKRAHVLQDLGVPLQLRRQYAMLWIASVFCGDPRFEGLYADQLREMAKARPVLLYNVVCRTQTWLRLIGTAPLEAGSIEKHIIGLLRLEKEDTDEEAIAA